MSELSRCARVRTTAKMKYENRPKKIIGKTHSNSRRTEQSENKIENKQVEKPTTSF